MSLNRVVFMGRLVSDPELKQTPSGVSVATFRLAVDRNYAPKDGERQADFIPCVAWRQTGEFAAKYFAKGRMAIVEGSLQTRQYEDKQGNKRTAYEVIVEHMYFGDSKKDGAASAAAPAQTQYQAPASSAPVSQYDFGGVDVSGYDEGDLPF